MKQPPHRRHPFHPLAKGYFAALLLLPLFLFSCARAVQPRPADGGRYVADFPGEHSDDFDRIALSVKKVYSVTTYLTCQFRREDRVTLYHLRNGSWKKMAWGEITTQETVFGTGTIVGSGNGRVAVLTSSHIVNRPDTLTTLFDPEETDPAPCLRSASVRLKQEIWVRDLSAFGPFRVVAEDPAADIALLGKTVGPMADTLSRFPGRAGYARELGWGGILYIMGYPMGTLSLTRGLASPLSRRSSGEFTVDALLNKGFSGGPILAIRSKDGIPEPVGMVKTVSTLRKDLVRPATGAEQTPEWIPYRGESFVTGLEQVQYGLNVVVPMETIRAFYLQNRNALLKEGFDLDPFFGLGNPDAGTSPVRNGE